MATTTTPMKQQEDNIRNKAQEMAEKGKEVAGNVFDKAKDAATTVADKARDAASNVYEKSKDAASALGQKADDATHAVGKGIESLGGTMRQNLPKEGILGSAAQSVASGLETTGQYLEREGLPGLGDDMINLIRRNPLPAILVGVGFGFIIARLFTMNNRG